MVRPVQVAAGSGSHGVPKRHARRGPRNAPASAGSVRRCWRRRVDSNRAEKVRVEEEMLQAEGCVPEPLQPTHNPHQGGRLWNDGGHG